MEEQNKREKEFHNNITTTYMLCFLILITTIVLSNHSMFSGEGYIFFKNKLFAFLCLIALGSVMLYSNREGFSVRKFAGYSWVDLVYITIPAIISVVIMFFFGAGVNFAEVILLLPVLMAASVLGRAAGIIMSSICTAALIVFIWLQSQQPLLEVVQANLIMVGLLFLVGWFIGGMAGMEKEHREHLGQSLLTLKNEIAAREKAEERLHLLSCAVEQSPGIVMITDTFGKVEYVNNKFSQVTGYLSEEIKGCGLYLLDDASEEKCNQVREFVLRGQEWRGEILNIYPSPLNIL